MQHKRLLSYLSIFLLCISHAWASCKGGEGDPFAPHPSPTQRIYAYPATNPSLDTSSKSGNVLDILSFNIQSGLNYNCQFDLNTQMQFMKSAHFFGLQEVDEFIDLRCGCSQPERIAQGTGHSTVFLNTILYRTGRYGSALGTAFPIIETRYHMFVNYFGEERGITAIRARPFQLGGKDLWYLNTHFQFDGEYWRNLQAQETVAYAKSLLAEFPQALLILTGDFYITPGLGSYATMEAYFLNAWAYSNGSPNGGFTYPSTYPTNRFDHVWFKFPAGTNFNLQTEIVNTLASDHRPLWAHFTFPSTSNPTNPTNPTNPNPTNPTPPSSGCSTQLTATLRNGATWSANGGQGVEGQYDIVITNSGQQTALRSNININLAGAQTITSWWNFARVAPSYVDLPALSPGSSYYSAGFILQNPSSTTLSPPTITVTSTVCQ